MYQKIKNIPLLVRGKGRWAAIAVFALFIGIVSNAVLFSNNASAATLGLTEETDQSIQKLLLHRTLAYCIKNADLSGGSWFDFHERINNNDDANSGKWFGGSSTSYIEQPVTVGTYLSDSRLGLNAGDFKNPFQLFCSNQKLIAMALSAVGGSDDGVTMLCKIGLVRADGSSTNLNTCEAGNGDFMYPDDTRSGGDSIYQRFLSAYPEPALDDEGWYWFYRKTFNWSCGYGKMTAPVTRTDIANNQYGYGLKYVTDSEPWFTTTYIIGYLKRTDTVNTRLGTGGGADTVNRTCDQIEKHITEYADKYIVQLASMTDEQLQERREETLAADNEAGSAEVTKCVVEGIGWIVCPLMNAIGGVSDAMYGWIASILELNPLQMEDSNGEQTPQYVAWQRIRDIANVLLVIVFLIVIFSQLTSIGVSNYGVKKLLPRIIMVAILINVSFLAMMLAIDLVNIIGSSLYDILIGLAPDVTGSTLDGTNAIGSFITGLVGGTLVGAGVSIGLGTIGAPALALLALPFLAVAALSLLAAIATLFIRNALVIILVLVAPVAFAAMLLPNTQPLFDRWRKLLFGVLFLYPTAALLFGGTKFAAYVIANSDQPLTILVAIFVMAAPLGLLPWLATSSGGILGSIGGKLQSLAKSAKSPLQRALKSSVDNQRAGYQAGRRNIFGRRRTNEQMAARDAAGRRNWGQKLAQASEARKTDTATAEATVGEQVKERGLNGATRRDRRYGQILDDQQTLSTRKGANEASYKVRADRRKQDVATVDYDYNVRQEDASAESKTITAELADAQRQRTVAPGVLNDVEMRLKQAQQSTSRFDSQLEGQFKEQVAADAALSGVVQEKKLADEQVKTLDSEQQVIFDRAKQTDAAAVDLVQRQDAVERETGAINAELKEARELEAEASPVLSQFDERKEDATFRTGVVEGGKSLRAEDRQLSDPALAALKLEDAANKKTSEALGKGFEQLVTEATTESTDPRLAGLDPTTRAQLQGSQRAIDIAAGATASAQRVQRQELADAIRDTSTGVATEMAGIDDVHGEALVDAQAFETQRKAYDANVAAYGVRIKEQGTQAPALFSMTQDPALTAEEREAAGRAIVTGGDIEAIQPYQDYLATSLAAARASGNTAEEARIGNLQKAYAETIVNSPGKPMGLGAADIAAFRTGTYLPPTPHASVPTPLSTAGLTVSQVQTLNTVMEKGVSMDNWASMDKQDIKLITQLVDGGFITGPRLANLKDTLEETRKDVRWKGRIKERELGLLKALEDRIP